MAPSRPVRLPPARVPLCAAATLCLLPACDVPSADRSPEVYSDPDEARAFRDRRFSESRSAETAEPNLQLSPSPEASRSVYLHRRRAEGAPVLSQIVVHHPERGGNGVRVVLHFDRVAVFSRRNVPATTTMPRRLIFTFDDAIVDPLVPLNIPVASGGLLRVRGSPNLQEELQLAFDIEDDAALSLSFLLSPYRLVLDFAGGAAGADAIPVPALSHIRRVVLDPGHGGDDYGARYEDLTEARLALDIALRTEAALRRRLPEVEVLLTRRDDEPLALDRRTALANAVRADIFVSIHLNSADDPVRRGGVATFVLDTSNDRQAIRLAARENGASVDEVTGMQRLLAGLHREVQLEDSLRLAELVQGGTVSGARRVLPWLRDRGVKRAMFFVLVGASMPSVLVEASFLTQPREAKALRTEVYRQSLAEGIAEGIIRYAREKH
ncbi:MAG: N-acetylmuramoyl-L-alanine amidase [Myxococcota bacterium]